MAWLGLLIPITAVGAVVALVVIVAGRTRKRGQAPQPVSPRHLFLQLLASATLYISAAGVLTLIWGLADYWFPDRLQSSGIADAGPVRFGISATIVSFPVFVYLTISHRKRIRCGQAEPGSPWRIGFIFFNLFVIAVAGLIDLMVMVNTLLNGDLTARFVVKAGGVLAILALVLLYFRADLGVKAPSHAPELTT